MLRAVFEGLTLANPSGAVHLVGTTAFYRPSGSGSNGCATVNNTTIEAPWGPNYSFKGSAKSGWVSARRKKPVPPVRIGTLPRSRI